MSVVEFPKPKPDEPAEVYVRVCACHCQSFQLRDDGTALCANCGTTAEGDNGTWFQTLEDSQRVETPTDTSFKTLTGVAGLSQRRLAEKVLKPDTCLVMVADEGGSTVVWNTADSIQQTKWMLDRADDLRNALEAQYEQLTAPPASVH